MTNITPGQARAILTGTELGGNAAKAYRVTLAVPNVLLGTSRGKNNSGFSFGVVQLDIANNSFAKAAYAKVLDIAKAAGQITQAQRDHLAAYANIARPDLNPATKAVYASDKTLLNTLFGTPAAHHAVDEQSDAYLARALIPTVNKFLTVMTNKYGKSSVFDPGNSHHRPAYAAVTSTANRTGGLAGSTSFYLATAPSKISVVKNFFVSQFQASDWSLIEIGATMLQRHDTAFPNG